MDSLWEILGGGFAFISLLFGVIFFGFIGLSSLYEIFQKSIWNDFKQILSACSRQGLRVFNGTND